MTEEQYGKAVDIKRQIGRINQIISILDRKHCTARDMENLGNSLYELYKYSKEVYVSSLINNTMTDLTLHYDSKFESI